MTRRRISLVKLARRGRDPQKGLSILPRGDQVTRQWHLIRLLTGKYGRTLAQLRSELGVTKRTVQRDIADLERAGFPVISEERNGTVFWHFMEGFHAEGQVGLTLTEQMALYFSKGMFQPLRGTPMYEALESAIQKIGSGLPAQSFEFLRGLDKAVSVSDGKGKDYSKSKSVIESLTQAIFHHYTVRFRHRAAQYKEFVEHEVNPYRLWYVNSGLYVVGFDKGKQDLRVFAVERIHSVVLTNKRFQVPPAFDFEAFKQTAFNMIWGEPQEVKIKFSPTQATYIRERTWHQSQKIDQQKDGSVVLSLHVADLDEVKRWLIGFGSEATVLTPRGLRDEISDEAEALLKNLRSPRVGKGPRER
jgi:predicted DNA-binding transcriptional regulator YafY